MMRPQRGAGALAWGVRTDAGAGEPQTARHSRHPAQLRGPRPRREGAPRSGVKAAARRVLAVLPRAEKPRPRCWRDSGSRPGLRGLAAPGRALEPERPRETRRPHARPWEAPPGVVPPHTRPRDRPSPGARGSRAPDPSLLHRSGRSGGGPGPGARGRTADACGCRVRAASARPPAPGRARRPVSF